MTIQAHANAVLALLAAAPGSPGLVVLDGAVPKGTNPPYVLVYLTVLTLTGEQRVDSTPLTLISDRVVLTAYCHSVGGDAKAARAVAQRVRAALLNVTPTIAGRSCWPIKHDENQPPERDETTGALRLDQVDLYRLESVPA